MVVFLLGGTMKQYIPEHEIKFHKELGGIIYSARKELGITQKNLADSLGITFQQMQKYEKGYNRISVYKLYQIAKILNISIDDILRIKL